MESSASSVSSKESKCSLIWSHFTQIGSDNTNMILLLVTFENDDNYSIRFEMKNDYSHSTKLQWY